MRATLLAVLGLINAVPAQINVSGGGAGLAIAVAAAPDGAVLLVQPGNYAGFTMAGKGLVILGASGVAINGTIDISNTLPHQKVVLRGLTWPTAQISSGHLLALTNCAGSVLLENITQPPHMNCLPSSPPNQCIRTIGLHADQCAQLYVRDCSLHCTARLDNCDAVIESTSVEGDDWMMVGVSITLAARR